MSGPYRVINNNVNKPRVFITISDGTGQSVTLRIKNESSKEKLGETTYKSV